MDDFDDVTKLHAEVARLRAEVEQLPHVLARRESDRALAKDQRLRGIAKLDPAEALPELAELPAGDVRDVLILAGHDRAVEILRGANEDTRDRLLAPLDRPRAAIIRSRLADPDDVPRTAWVSATSTGGNDCQLVMAAPLRRRLIDAGVGCERQVNTHHESYVAYVPPSISPGYRHRWPTWAVEALRERWPAFADGSIDVVPATLNEDRELLAHELARGIEKCP